MFMVEVGCKPSGYCSYHIHRFIIFIDIINEYFIYIFRIWILSIFWRNYMFFHELCNKDFRYDIHESFTYLPSSIIGTFIIYIDESFILYLFHLIYTNRQKILFFIRVINFILRMKKPLNV